MTFPHSEGWAVVAALRDYADAHPEAADAKAWRAWSKELERELRTS
jgi:hypothetical protein